MAHSISLTATERAAQYQELLPQIEAVIAGETNRTANLANVAAILKEAFGWFWVGFYLVDSPEELVLGPFQGPLACTRIRKGRGVCGTAWERAESILVEDVELFEGHIACSSLSRSEVVVPIIARGEVVGVIDVDSELVAHFDAYDQVGLEQVAQLIAKLF